MLRVVLLLKRRVVHRELGVIIRRDDAKYSGGHFVVYDGFVVFANDVNTKFL